MSSELSRGDFIVMMIAELARQKESDECSFNLPKLASSEEVFRSLCFDFPIVSAVELSALSAHINNFSSSSKDTSDVFWLNDKFLENMSYLGTSGPSDEIDRERAVSTLCAAVFLKLPRRMLSMTKEQLSAFFCGSSESDLLSWGDICQRYRRLVLQGTASLVSGIDAAQLSSGAVSAVKGTPSEGYLRDISGLIGRIRWDESSRSNKSVDLDSMTLEQCLLFNSEKASKTEAEEEAGRLPHDTYGHSESKEGGEEGECAVISGIAKDVWVHSAFLYRDLLVQYPMVVTHASGLPEILGSLLPVGTGGGSPFPTSAECMFALILSGVITGITAHSAPPTAPSSAVEGEVTAAMWENSHDRVRLRANQQLEARAGLRKYLNTSSPSLLTAVVGICERICRNSTNCDGALLLCDIASVYTADMGYAQPHPHERLISGRAVSALVQMWVSTVSGHLSGDAARTSASTAGVRLAASRMCQMLSVLCLQRAETAVFVLRIPSFATTVLRASEAWQPLEGGDEGGLGLVLLPGDAVGLLTALLLAAATLPASSLECPFAELHECLQSALASAETVLSTPPAPPTAVSAAGGGQRPPRRVLACPQGLVGSLRLVTGEEGGARLLRSVSTGSTGGQQGKAQTVVSLLKRWSASVLRSTQGNRGRARPATATASTSVIHKSESVDTIDAPAESSAEGAVAAGTEGSAIGSSAAFEEGVDEGLEGEQVLEGVAEEGEGGGQGEPTQEEKDRQEREEEEEAGVGEVEEVRRLLKALQAILEGLSTSKID